ncbi:uncharacterized protein LOC131604726 [Vicia villosa]|uniref:uncharacterized protein LOC131604726 n=1 Tax=Vicia villosa TaxID=3911 RepID=UPI00273C510F|nr:uncharacterized protein LOC131604726 [Vicia villosa]
MLAAASPVQHDEDAFLWNQNSSGSFSVASVSALIAENKEIAWPAETMDMLKVLWKLTVPLKFKVFAWRLFISRLPVKESLIRRGVTIDATNACCEFCRLQPENLNHLFFDYPVSNLLWGRIFTWMGVDLTFSLDEFMVFGKFYEKVKMANSRLKINTIWLATTWSIWFMRNAMIFDKVPYSFDVVYSNILYLSWNWLASSNPLSFCSFYDWFKSTLDCFNSL